MKSKILNIIIVVVSICIFLSFFLFTKGLKTLINEIRTLSTSWIILSALMMIMFLFFETLVLYVIIRQFHRINNLFVKCLRFEIIGQFFGAITPFAAASHPAQLYEMSESGISGGTGVSILMIKFMIHQVINIIILVLAILFKFKYFYSKVPYFLYFCISGLVVHVMIMIIATLFLLNKKLTSTIVIYCLNLLKKVKLLKNPEETYKQLETELKTFHKTVFMIIKYKKLCLYSSILTLLQWLAYFSIPYCIYRGFGFNYSDIFTMVAAQVFLVNFMAIIPLPGAEGGAEGGFYLIYGLFFKSGTIITAIFLWRLITYYSSIAIGSIFTLLLPNSNSSRNMNKN
ncbi:flippase-like domain-containing protein [Clostridium sp. YIM B02505]|uniref:Phosphatidylglycerol lysyltransferase n=1 Tax=Clostridium yunnanense TaxID=2800325 RepID=A0ABS1EIU8_9CLOT|nr:lysylphosphatidylglycerol synthase transmembrane domain-containing protein [Clostridium yunnanense]MBK1809283.1 flippase-like domain-containing protein [Clostridium yunnanense]